VKINDDAVAGIISRKYGNGEVLLARGGLTGIGDRFTAGKRLQVGKRVLSEHKALNDFLFHTRDKVLMVLIKQYIILRRVIRFGFLRMKKISCGSYFPHAVQCAQRRRDHRGCACAKCYFHITGRANFLLNPAAAADGRAHNAAFDLLLFALAELCGEIDFG
jgi:hypothetical protein